MDPTSRNARVAAGLFAFGLMIAALAFLFFGPTAVAQGRRLARIQEHQRVLAPRLAADPRFPSIRLGVSTTDGGGLLLVHGALDTDADLGALKALVASTEPPCPVLYRVRLSKQ